MNGLLVALRCVSEEVRDRADELNELDGRAGDGDLGVTVAMAAAVVLGLLPELEGATVETVLNRCGSAVAREAPSTAGTLIAMALLRAGRAAVNGAESDAATLACLLEAARAGIAERGKAERGSKTMLDALAPAAEAAADAADRGESLSRALAAAAEAADAGAKATVSMLPRHGRAGWLPERSIGHEDAGARLVAIILAAAARSLSTAPPEAGDSGRSSPSR
jgi:dihydroxyacetone kinase-like protein